MYLICFYFQNYKTNLLRKINRRNPVNSETMNTVPLEQYQFTSVNRVRLIN